MSKARDLALELHRKLVMKPETIKPTLPAVTELIEWLVDKLAAAEKALRIREEMAVTWRGGTDAQWKAASPDGRSLSRADRLKQSASHARIAVRMRRDVEIFRATLNALGHPQP